MEIVFTGGSLVEIPGMRDIPVYRKKYFNSMKI